MVLHEWDSTPPYEMIYEFNICTFLQSMQTNSASKLQVNCQREGYIYIPFHGGVLFFYRRTKAMEWNFKDAHFQVFNKW